MCHADLQTTDPLLHGQDGVRIAYATSGRGPPLVKAANWLSHLEFDVGSPVWSHLLTELSRHHTLIRYDERGCGLSDREVADLSFDAWLHDLESVVDAAQVERFPLLGISQGASIAVAYAIRHPQRVSHLILHGGYARGRLKRNPTPQQSEQAELMNRLAEIGWGQHNPAFRQAQCAGYAGAYRFAAVVSAGELYPITYTRRPFAAALRRDRHPTAEKNRLGG